MAKLFYLCVFAAMAVYAYQFYRYHALKQYGFGGDPHSNQYYGYGNNIELGAFHFRCSVFFCAYYFLAALLLPPFTAVNLGGLPISHAWLAFLLYIATQIVLPVVNLTYIQMRSDRRALENAVRRKDEAEAAQSDAGSDETEPAKTALELAAEIDAAKRYFRKLARDKLPDEFQQLIIECHDDEAQYEFDGAGRPVTNYKEHATQLIKWVQRNIEDFLPNRALVRIGGRGRPWAEFYQEWLEQLDPMFGSANPAFNLTEYVRVLYGVGDPFIEAVHKIEFESIVPHDLRTRHHSIIGGTGHGKTQCLQQMILRDFEEDNACVIVIDSQGSMLEKLLHVVPGDRVMYLDGGNIRQPLALSAFSIGSTSKPEDEPKVRTAVALYEHMFAARDTALTTTQSTLYRFLSRFLMVIPNANFDTALSILQEGYERYAAYVDQLDTTSQKFVTSELCDPKDKQASNSYRTTRQEVARRLFTLMESRTLKGMFNAPESKVDIPAAIRNQKIILINTAQSVLGDEGAQLFGKYCFAQIAMEILTRPETKNRVYLYLDEAQEYLSDSLIIRRLYEQGRKRGLCVVTACQELDQLERAGIDKLINSLTSIKFAGGVSASDAAKLAKEMDTDAEKIRSVPELTFAAWFKHHGTGTYKVTPGLLEAQIDTNGNDVETLKRVMLDQYHYNPEAEVKEEGAAEDDSAAGDAEPDYDSYWNDDLGEDATPNEDDKPRRPPESDDTKPFDPDAPQDLD
mmetsp:Transcript_29195/g.56439  ORF Transcript_29195/g.56439 Transcript_29195/m.56439 type:complete len:741 (+) Transcript_29195:357-2579(+)